MKIKEIKMINKPPLHDHPLRQALHKLYYLRLESYSLVLSSRLLVMKMQLMIGTSVRRSSGRRSSGRLLAMM